VPLKPKIALSNKERFPLIEDVSFLDRLKQDQYAPKFNFESGDRLTVAYLKEVINYEKKIRFDKKFWNQNENPDWLNEFVRYCVNTVPFYQSRSHSFLDQPTIRRSDIQSAPWLFVSSETEVDDLLVYQTSGTTGLPMDVLFNPVSQACWLPQLQSVLDTYNIQISTDSSKVAIALICAQSHTLTYASLSTYLKGAGVLKINLNVHDWNNSSHRKKYLEKWNPEILTGDPFAFMALLDLNPNIRPKAMISSAMKLNEGLRSKLEDCFQCLVLDIYSLTECRMIAFADGGNHRAIRPDLYLEIFDREKDILLPYGERGELVVTGGNNPFLPLIRYRTGDYCSIQINKGVPYLVELEARNTVLFYNYHGNLVNNIEISRGLSIYPLAGYSLHQKKNRSLVFIGWSNEVLNEVINERLLEIFGPVDINVLVNKIGDAGSTKPVSYSSDLE
jgi:phenylacetate-CoA ligase